jgi:hypothetical protein
MSCRSRVRADPKLGIQGRLHALVGTCLIIPPTFPYNGIQIYLLFEAVT